MIPDMQKMFDPAQATQMMNKMFDASNVEQQAEAWKQLSSVWSETLSSCYEQQMKMAQEAVQTSVECMKELSSAKGIEDMMAKQATWSKKCTETCQSNAQTIAQTMQKGYQKATDIITKNVSSSMKQTSSASSSK